MEKLLTMKEYKRMTDELDKIKYRCNKCGHREVIPKCIDKKICSWCGNYVFKDKKSEFDYRVQERMKKVVVK